MQLWCQVGRAAVGNRGVAPAAWELETSRLDPQLEMLGDVTRESRCSTVKDEASCLLKLYPQTRALSLMNVLTDILNTLDIHALVRDFISSTFACQTTFRAIELFALL